MPKKQKRFKSEQAILRAIDAQDKKQKEKYAEAEKHEADAVAMTRFSYKPEEIQWQRTLSERARRSAERAANKKVELGKALSAMRTLLLPMPLNDDTSVTL